MADTFQSVTWALEFACPFRQGSAADDIDAAWRATVPLKDIDAADANGKVFGDLCVTSTVYSEEGEYPGNGFRIGEAVAAVGDLPAARHTCSACPANASLRTPPEMAGCCGRLYCDPDDPDLEKSLRLALRAPDAAALFASAFVRTKPLWYGLWIDSPPSRDQLRALRALVPHVPRDNAVEDRELREFDRACEISVVHDVPLHVRLAPLGHTDFGIYGTFPHCPRCKKHTGEWRQQHYSATPTACTACGHAFVPADTAKSEPMEELEEVQDRTDLEHLLPPAEYKALVAEWRRRHAADPPNQLERLSAEIGVDSEPGASASRDASPDEASTFLSRWLRRLRGKSGT